MSRPNIRPAVKPHSTCRRQDWNDRPLLGDVRRCHHGTVQVLTEIGVNSNMQGPGMNWWRDLHPFWNRREYRAAIAALGETK